MVRTAWKAFTQRRIPEGIGLAHILPDISKGRLHPHMSIRGFVSMSGHSRTAMMWLEEGIYLIYITASSKIVLVWRILVVYHACQDSEANLVCRGMQVLVNLISRLS